MLSTAALPERNLAYLKHSETYQNEKKPFIAEIVEPKNTRKSCFFYLIIQHFFLLHVSFWEKFAQDEFRDQPHFNSSHA